MGSQIIWEDGRPGRRFLVERAEAERELEKLTGEQLDELESAYEAAPKGDPWAFGRKARTMHAEAVRRGWLLGPA